MCKRWFGVCVIIVGLSLTVCSQGTADQPGTSQSTQEQIIAANKLRAEQLKHPTFISLKLISQRRDTPREDPSTTPSPYVAGDVISFQLLITQSQFDELMLANHMSPSYEYRPDLSKDGSPLSYTKDAQEKAEIAERRAPSGSVSMVQLRPNREVKWTDVNINYWYGSLAPGHYQLTVRKHFAPDGDWAESNPVTFDVVARGRPSSIPDGVTVRLVPQRGQTPSNGQTYQMSSDDYLDVVIANDSDQSVRINVIDSYYGNRFQLFKDGKLVPYLEETAKLIESKDAKSSSVDVVSDLFIKPKNSSQLEGVNLKKWYGPLSPGIYHLTDRRRFEIGGPWTKDSPELVIEIVP